MVDNLIVNILKHLSSIDAEFEFIDFGDLVRFISSNKNVTQYITSEVLNADGEIKFRVINGYQVIDIECA